MNVMASSSAYHRFKMQENKKKANFEALPSEVIEQILSYLPYGDVCTCSLVNRKCNYASRRILKNGFLDAEKYFSECQKKLRAQMPCCAAKRKKHPLGKYCGDMLNIEAQLSLIKPDFMKYADKMMCFFVPGTVLDICYKRLRSIDKATESFIKKMQEKEAKKSKKRKIRNKSESCPYSKNQPCHEPAWEDHEEMNFYKTCLKYEHIFEGMFPSEERERRLAKFDHDVSKLWYKIA
ncbi:F-box only protein 28, partial [Stegodyphus mimosarum]